MPRRSDILRMMLMRHLRFLLALAGLQAMLHHTALAQVPTAQLPTTPPQHGDVRFSLVPTQNVWTFLLLDSRTGRVWQIHFAVSDSAFAGRLPINEEALASAPTARDGRFSIHATQNMYNFLLLDQDDGRVWQVQWSNNEAQRGMVGLLSGSAK
jgi:hypothetical protein